MAYYNQGQTLSQVSDTFTLQSADGGRNTTQVAAGVVGNTVIKGTPGRVGKVSVTATGTNQLNIYDNATTAAGTILLAIPANAAVGTVYDVQFPAAAGITVAGNAANPGVTIGWD